MVQPARQRFDFADYVRLEESSNTKHEFLGGTVWAMAGGSPDHARVIANVSALLNAQLSGKRCSVFSSDLMVRIQATGLATYPDVTVVCERLELDPEDPKRHAVINPRVIVEVLSPSTEAYDRGEKLDHYRQMPSLAAVVLVAHDRHHIDLWRRDGNRWTMVAADESGTVDLEEIGCCLHVEDVYRDPLAG